MKLLTIVISIFFIAMLVFRCEDQSVNKVDPPAKVVLIESSADTSAVERGIDAMYVDSNPNKNAIIFQWRPNKESTLVGYEIYRSTSATQNYTSFTRIVKNFGVIDTFYVDNSVSLYIRYYYFIRAFDELGQYGEPSDTISYKLIENAVLSSPVGIIGNVTAPLFIWDFPPIVPHYFVFRLERSENEIYRNLYSKLIELTVDYDPHQEWTLVKLIGITALSPGKYRWRIDSIGSELNQGAESAWFVFIIQ